MKNEARLCNGEIVFLISCARKKEQLYVNEINHSLTPYTKINSKWIKNLNVRLEIIKFLKESMDIKGSNIVSDLSPKARETKAKINK